MGLFGKQNWFCCNCGIRIYDIVKWSWWPCCSKSCHEEYRMKETRSILGKDDMPLS